MKTTTIRKTKPVTRKRSANVPVEVSAAAPLKEPLATSPPAETPKSSGDTKFYFKIHLNNRFPWGAS